MFSRKLAQRTNAWLIRVDFLYTHSWVNGLCFGYFQIFPERSPFDLTITLTPFPYVRRLLDLSVYSLSSINRLFLVGGSPVTDQQLFECMNTGAKRKDSIQRLIADAASTVER